MTTSHEFDLLATPEMKALLAFLRDRFQTSPEKAAGAQHDFEIALREHILEVERAVHGADFERLDVNVHGVVVDGVRYQRRPEKTPGVYMTMGGPIKVLRTTYRARGGHGGETIDVLALRLGLVDDHWTPAAAEVGCTFMASVPSKEAAGLLKAAGTMAPSSSHLDRLPKHVSEVWEKNREAFEAAVRDAERLDLPDPQKVALISFSLDGVMVPMKDAPRAPRAGKADTGPKGHKEVGCATVSLYDDTGERLHTVRFGRMPEYHKATLHTQLLAEIQAMRRHYPHARVEAVADGAPDNWRLIEAICASLGCEVTKVVDYYHAVEHLTEGMRATGAKAEELSNWRNRLRDEDGAVGAVVEKLTEHFAAGAPIAVTKALNYFGHQCGRMDYATVHAEHLPIGSGVQEAACKTLATQRMKRSGMSWRDAGGQAILTLRGHTQSGRMGHAWNVLRPAFVRRVDVDSNERRQLPKKVAA
jgi:hypothetical protein